MQIMHRCYAKIALGILPGTCYPIRSRENHALSTQYDGILEIDHARGVIYFHCVHSGRTLLRICSLPKPIPPANDPELQLDITHMHGTSWGYSS